MLQRGEPANVLVFVMVVIILGSAVFLGASADETASVTSAVSAPISSEPICGGQGGVCITLGAIMAGALGIGVVEITRRRA